MNRIKKSSIVNFGLFNSRKEVSDDVLEEWEVVFQELGDVDIS